MTKMFACLAVSAALAVPAFAGDTYAIDPAHTYPMFEVSHHGFSIQRGRFDRTSGSVTIDVLAGTGSLDVRIDATSINMGQESWNQQMRSEGFFDTERFPVIAFSSDHLVFEGGRLIGAEGNLTLLGIMRPVRLTVTKFHCGPNPIHKRAQCGADVTANIRRSEFGMNRALPGIGDEVRILVAIEAIKE